MAGIGVTNARKQYVKNVGKVINSSVAQYMTKSLPPVTSDRGQALKKTIRNGAPNEHSITYRPNQEYQN